EQPVVRDVCVYDRHRGRRRVACGEWPRCSDLHALSESRGSNWETALHTIRLVSQHLAGVRAPYGQRGRFRLFVPDQLLNMWRVAVTNRGVKIQIAVRSVHRIRNDITQSVLPHARVAQELDIKSAEE